MTGDPAFTWILLGLRVRGLSTSPRSIPAVKSLIGQSRIAEMEDMVAKARALRSEIEDEELVLGIMRARFPLELTGSDEV
jgi:phosphoenolpyruvate-protein kinase (PTS system EI component)